MFLQECDIPYKHMPDLKKHLTDINSLQDEDPFLISGLQETIPEWDFDEDVKEVLLKNL